MAHIYLVVAKNKYKVHGLKEGPLINTKRVDHLFYDNKIFNYIMVTLPIL